MKDGSPETGEILATAMVPAQLAPTEFEGNQGLN